MGQCSGSKNVASFSNSPPVIIDVIYLCAQPTRIDVEGKKEHPEAAHCQRRNGRCALTTIFHFSLLSPARQCRSRSRPPHSPRYHRDTKPLSLFGRRGVANNPHVTKCRYIGRYIGTIFDILAQYLNIHDYQVTYFSDRVI